MATRSFLALGRVAASMRRACMTIKLSDLPGRKTRSIEEQMAKLKKVLLPACSLLTAAY